MSLKNSFDLSVFDIHELASANMAGNAGIDISLSQNCWFRLRAIYFEITTDATAVNRWPRILYSRTGFGDFAIAFPDAAITASKAVRGCFALGLLDLQTSTQQMVSAPLPDIILLGNELITFEIQNGVAGDVVANIRTRWDVWQQGYNL